MIYLDSSIALARVFAEPNAPRGLFWRQQMVSSRLLEYEMWNRLHAYRVVESHAGEAVQLLSGIELLELSRGTLARALEPWPLAIRTLDALHLATADYLRRNGEVIELASYDRRLIAGAQALGIPLAVI